MHIEELTVELGGYTRTVWFSGGPKKTSHPLCVFLDGDHYLESVRAHSIVQQAVDMGHVPHMSLVFVAHDSAAARHENYTCNDSYARFVAEDLLRWAKSRNGAIRSTGNVVCGLSLSGLASAYIALKFPRVFSSSLCQSGSFWWSDRRFVELARGLCLSASRYWLSVGDGETEDDVFHPPTGMYQGISQIAGVQSAVEALTATGADVRYHLHTGGHEFGPWGDELTDALQWLTGDSQ